MKNKGQGALEYLLLIGGGLIVTAVVVGLTLSVMDSGSEIGHTAGNKTKSILEQGLAEIDIGHAPSLPSGRTAYWPMNENSGNNIPDEEGTNDATNNGATWVAGRAGNALDFEYSESDYASAGYVPFNSRSFTISLWIRSESLTTEHVFFSQNQSGSSNMSLHLRAYSNGQIRFGFYMNDLTTSAGAVAAGNWYHLAFVYDVSAGSRSVYVNGVRRAYQASGVNPYLGTSGLTRIGRWDIAGQRFDGIIDEIMIFNRALSEAEVNEVMNLT